MSAATVKIFRGLKNARFGFTDIINAARNNMPVVIVEVGHDRKTNIGYKLVRITDDELKAAIDSDPQYNVPAPKLPAPDMSTLLD